LQDKIMDMLYENNFNMTIHGHTHTYTWIEDENEVTTLVLGDLIKFLAKCAKMR